MHEDEKNVKNKQTGKNIGNKKNKEANNPPDNFILSLPMYKDKDGGNALLCKFSIAFVFTEQSHCVDTEKSLAGDNSHFLSETTAQWCRHCVQCWLSGVQ